MMRRLIALLLMASLAGCASLPKGPGCVKIGPWGAACLLPPSALPAVQAEHIVSVEHDATKDTFLGRLGIDDQTMRLAAASLFGTHLFTLRWDGEQVAMDPPREGMHPDLIVAMLQVAVADPERLRPRLHGLDLTVQPTAGGGEVRELHEHGRLVARIRKSAAPLDRATLSIDIPPVDMHLRLEPMEAR